MSATQEQIAASNYPEYFIHDVAGQLQTRQAAATYDDSYMGLWGWGGGGVWGGGWGGGGGWGHVGMSEMGICMGTWGQTDMRWTRRHGDKGTWGQMDMGTWGQTDMGTWETSEMGICMGTWGQTDMGTCGDTRDGDLYGDMGTDGHEVGMERTNGHGDRWT